MYVQWLQWPMLPFTKHNITSFGSKSPSAMYHALAICHKPISQETSAAGAVAHKSDLAGERKAISKICWFEL